MDEKKLRIVFMGTPDFAVETLKTLTENKYNVVAVVTVPDKPSGRGQKLNHSPVKEFAQFKNIPYLQPEKLKNPDFLLQLQNYNADVFIVVAFRMLPEAVWQMPPKGTINLHASLLPQYRGAAPINWAIINGEKKTGVTTFFIEKDIDTGKIIFQQEEPILETDDAGTLHDKLMIRGAKLVIHTIDAINSNTFNSISQEKIVNHIPLKSAPKLFKENCKINWQQTATEIHNFVRGLSPYPAAYTEFKNNTTGEIIQAKIYETQIFAKNQNNHDYLTKEQNKSVIFKECSDAYIAIKSLQLAGKKRLYTDEFLRGFQMQNYSIHL